ncbi:hypothetical protein [Nocardia wallacei]|uniref:hypothetical protein n=1 Tax=Nocardia wallacei TaxID=480035 RepID=UPI002457F62B|nr:hypothetical protein [Nocardia wallacei]
MTTAEFTSVYSLIKQTLADTPEMTDPREIAECVARQIPEEMRLQLLANALVSQVRDAMRGRRNSAIENVIASRPLPPSQPRPVFGATPRPALSAPTSIQAERVTSQPRSRKVEQIRDWWAEMLASRVHVGSSRWMPLGDCGIEELKFAEQERRNQAQETLKRANTFLRLRMLLDKHEVDTVSQLPSEAVRAELS